MTSDEDDSKLVRILRFIATALYVTFIIISLAADAAESKFGTD